MSMIGKPDRGTVEMNSDECKGCGLCVRECPVNKQGEVKALESVRDEV